MGGVALPAQWASAEPTNTYTALARCVTDYTANQRGQVRASSYYLANKHIHCRTPTQLAASAKTKHDPSISLSMGEVGMGFAVHSETFPEPLGSLVWTCGTLPQGSRRYSILDRNQLQCIRSNASFGAHVMTITPTHTKKRSPWRSLIKKYNGMFHVRRKKERIKICKREI